MDYTQFIENQYLRHANHFDDGLSSAENARLTNSWFDETTADYWRHIRAFECAELLANDPSSSWITIGDGRWGLDSIRIKSKGFQKVLPTDISEFLLAESKMRDYIVDYAIENAEKLSFSDRSFDFAFCKESFHHFPRPYLALYEMLRVSRKGVFLIEPNDIGGTSLNLDNYFGRGMVFFKNILKVMLRRPIIHSTTKITWNEPGWESSGNYVYGISRREAEKICLGINLPQLLVKGLNDFYVEGCEFEPADESVSDIFKKIKSSVEKKDIACKDGQAPPDLLMLGFLHEKLSEDMRIRFMESGWEVIDLPRNPYL